MALYDALVKWLVVDGPLDALYTPKLPSDNAGADVVVAAIPISGTGASYYLGSAPVDDRGDGITDDAGVLWIHGGMMFHARAAPDRTLVADTLLGKVRDRMLLLRGGEREIHPDPEDTAFDGWQELTGRSPESERIAFVQLTTDVQFLEQDQDGLDVYWLQFEIWHTPVRVRRLGSFSRQFSAAFDRVGP